MLIKKIQVYLKLKYKADFNGCFIINKRICACLGVTGKVERGLVGFSEKCSIISRITHQCLTRPQANIDH